VKRSNLRRVTPLQNSTPIARHTPMRRATQPLARSAFVQKAPRAKLTSRQRKPVEEPSEGWCEVRLWEICTGRATDTAHRLGEGMGGRHGTAAEVNDRPSNVLRSCRACHRWCHEWPILARRVGGWLLRNGDDPLTTPVLYRGEEWVLLDDEGGMRPYEFGEAS
jgi:5-methylcytosine-specific restriction protein A